MVVEIKEIIDYRGKWKGAFGRIQSVSPGRALITVSMAQNDTVAKYAETLLHEILHLWCNIIKRKGAQIDRRREHRFIEAVEDMVLVKLEKMKLKRRKRHANH